AVVQRRYQRIRHRMREPRQVAVGAGRVDHYEVVGVLDAGYRVGEAAELDRLVFLDLRPVATFDAIVDRQFEIEVRVARPGAAVLDVVGEALLARIKVDGGDALAGLHQRHRDVHGGGRLSRSALLVTENDHVRGNRPGRNSLVHRPPKPTLLRTARCNSSFAFRDWSSGSVFAGAFMINHRVAEYFYGLLV